MAGAPPKPLKGLKVLDLSRVLAGPFAGQMLADLGADVIKIESPAGDDTRRWGPPFITRDNGDVEAAYYHACNRGKRSVIADLKQADDLAKVKVLAAHADVLLENFKVGGLVKYGLDHDSLRKAHPGLIYCAITGFGQTGPKSTQAGYDLMIQGLSGIMSLTGEPEREPQKMGMAFADIFTGIYAVVAIQAALLERSKTGQGTFIDMALMDCMTGVLANQAMNYLASGHAPRRMGNAHPNIVPYQAFACRDGHIIIAVGNDGQFQRLLTVLGLKHLKEEKRFASNPDRVAHRQVLVPLLAEAMLHFDRAPLLNALEGATVPCGPIHDVGEALTDPQIIHRGLVLDQDGIPGLATPIAFNGTILADGKASPILGDTDFDTALSLFSNTPT